MKTLMALVFTFALLLVAYAASAQQTGSPATNPPPAASQSHAGHAGAAVPPGHEPGAAGNPMMEHCEQMQARHEQAMAKMKEMDAALDQKLAAMNQATGNNKVDAMAAVINEMASQRKEMQDLMMASHQGGMGQMMMGKMGAQGMQGMADCPMMQQMQKGKAPSAAAPQQQQSNQTGKQQ